jgi:hypothetical protein
MHIEGAGYYATDPLDAMSKEELIRFINDVVDEYAPDEIIDILKQKMYDDMTKGPKFTPLENKQEKGYIYLLAWNGNTKIGMTTRHPGKRLEEISPKMPTKPKLIFFYECGDVRSEERKLHNRFSEKRVNGEWFTLSERDIEYIAKRGGIK